MENIDLHIEAILFSSSQPASIQEIGNCLERLGETKTDDEILELIESIKQKYKPAIFPFEIIESGGGYQFLTKSDYHDTISNFLNQKANKKLSSAAMETLSIIAYKQPVTKLEIEQIRGVSSDYTVHKLLEKELIQILGKSEQLGKPILYGVSDYFLDYFGLNSTEELPHLKDIITQQENEIGESD